MASAYIAALTPEQLEPIAEYFSAEARRYGLSIHRPFEFLLGPVIVDPPPPPPRYSSISRVVLWSLEFRWWSWRRSPPVQMPADIRLYLMYYDPARTSSLAHSTALNKGRIGLVNVFASRDYRKTNEVMIAHELLHTVGATDKYDLASNQPLFPIGYAEPQNDPRYPQSRAELMAGRIPVSESQAIIPEGLTQTILGEASAMEIHWIGHH